jgi:hypothetical protein
MSLPEHWVDKLFSKLSATYGQSFLRQYDGVDPADVKAEWGEVLSRFQQSPDAIRYGLDNLPPDRAPNPLQFRDLCRRAPDAAFSKPEALPAPESTPVAPEVIAATKAAFERKDTRGWRDWAVALKRRHESGERLTRFQIRAYRETLGIGQQEAA